MSKLASGKELWRRVRASGQDPGIQTGDQKSAGYETSGTWFAVPVDEEWLWHDGYEPIRKRMPHEGGDARW